MIAVEIDPRLAGELPATVAARMPERAAALSVITADALRIDDLPLRRPPWWPTCPTTSPCRCCCTCWPFPSWTRGLVMVQAEVADRLAARPGSKIYGVPSVKMAWYADVGRVGTVPPTVFWPVPNVESGLVAIRRRPAPADHGDPERGLRRGRRGLRPAAQDAALGAVRAGRLVRRGRGAIRAAGLDPQARGERLDVADFARIAEALRRPPSRIPDRASITRAIASTAWPPPSRRARSASECAYRPRSISR